MPPTCRPPAAARRPPTASRIRPPALLRRGNAKLGPDLIWSFSTPAVETCPGSTAACRAACYARVGRYAFGSVQAAYAANLRRTTDPDFVDELVDEVRRNFIRVVRIHGSGDFFSAAYVRRWAEVARRCPRATFYAYTRSWKIPEIREALAEFARLPNVHLWYSADSDAGRPPDDPGVRVAWLMARGDGPDSAPAWADLAFRAGRRGPLKRSGGVLVCPYEQAVPRICRPITCDRCKICFGPPRRAASNP